MKTEHELRYPVGDFVETTQPDQSLCTAWREIITIFPAQVRTAVDGLSKKELDHRYRPGGWTIRQVVHHCADSHMNAFIRFKLALTETKPTIKPYDEGAWAELADYQLPIETSLLLLEGLHARWKALLDKMTEEDYQRSFFHPEHGTPFSLLLGLDNYHWHCRHHLAHIQQAKELQF